jgi:hypothetical protein
VSTLKEERVQKMEEKNEEEDDDDDYTDEHDVFERSFSSPTMNKELEEISTLLSTPSKGSPPKIGILPLGTRVEAKCDGWAVYYPGTISAIPPGIYDDIKYDITFDDGEVRLDVPGHVVRKHNQNDDKLKGDKKNDGIVNNDSSSSGGDSSGGGGNSSSSTFHPKFHKGQRVVAICDGWAQHYPGIINEVHTSKTYTYDIIFDDGETKFNVKENIIKVEDERPNEQQQQQIETGRTDVTDTGRTDVTDTGRTDVTDTGRTDVTDTGRTDFNTSRSEIDTTNSNSFSSSSAAEDTTTVAKVSAASDDKTSIQQTIQQLKKGQKIEAQCDGC